MTEFGPGSGPLARDLEADERAEAERVRRAGETGATAEADRGGEPIGEATVGEEAGGAAGVAERLDAASIRGRRRWPLPKAADPAAPLLVVRDLRTHFKLEKGWVRAVDGVSFRLDDGEAIGLVGESGCGKTTTALSLVQLLPANARIRKGSHIELYGIDLAERSEDRMRRYRWREISMVFQGAMNALNPVIRIGDQIAEPIEERLGQAHDDARRRAGELLELVGIPARRAEAYPHELSGGMRQRAMIAMALACDPALVIGDEPTTALDVMVQAQILELLERLRHELGLSLILITHDLSVTAETCDRVIVMYAGRIAEDGPVGRLYRVPRHPYTQRLLGAFPNVHADRRALDVIPGSPPDLREPPPGCRFHPRCPAVMDVCRAELPPEVRFPDGVRVACHLYCEGVDGAVAVTAEDVAGYPARGGPPGPSAVLADPSP